MTCRELSEFIADYLSGDLPADARALFDAHLVRCANCRHYLDRYRLTQELGRRAFDDDEGEVPADVPDELVQAILASRKR
jgi:anti-sigma factor RsiW